MSHKLYIQLGLVLEKSPKYQLERRKGHVMLFLSHTHMWLFLAAWSQAGCCFFCRNPNASCYRLSGTWGRLKQTLQTIYIYSLFPSRPLNPGDFFVCLFFFKGRVKVNMDPPHKIATQHVGSRETLFMIISRLSCRQSNVRSVQKPETQ